MHILFLMVVLAASEPAPDNRFLAEYQSSFLGTPAVVTVSTAPKSLALAYDRINGVRQSRSRLSRLDGLGELLPYGTELNDLYQRYRADGRWRNGIGFTFATSPSRNRWTFVIGPIQFVFGRNQNQSSQVVR